MHFKICSAYETEIFKYWACIQTCERRFFNFLISKVSAETGCYVCNIDVQCKRVMYIESDNYTDCISLEFNQKFALYPAL